MRPCFLPSFVYARARAICGFSATATVTNSERDVSQEMGTGSQSFNMLSERTQKKTSI